MPLRSIKPVRRYIVGILVVLVLVYHSGLHLDRNTISATTQVGSQTIANAYDSLPHNNALDHGIQHHGIQHDGGLDIDDHVVKLHEKKTLRRQIDMKYCGRERCRFILPIAITEQESKAQSHFRQLAFLAGKLERTIVLPNVHSSHLGACRNFPFDFYYSYEWLEENKQFFNYITMKDFQAWIYERHQLVREIPTAQEVYVEIRPDMHFLDGAVNCFKHTLDFENWPTKRYFLDDPEAFNKREGNYTEILLNMLGDEARRNDYLEYAGESEEIDVPPLDVIALFYDRRFGYIEEPQVEQPLSYNQRWVDLAESIANQLKPFVAIHWRMERLEPVENLVPCAMSLVRKVQEIANQNDQESFNVFLLTDYPHLLRSPLASPESMSFKLNQLQQEHHDAIQYVYERLNVTLTTVERDDRPIPYQDLPAENWNIIPIDANSQPPDVSVLGIVDKLIAMRAQYFLAGYQGVCGKPSSFTSRIIDERVRVFKEGNANIKLPFAYFFLPPDSL